MLIPLLCLLEADRTQRRRDSRTGDHGIRVGSAQRCDVGSGVGWRVGCIECRRYPQGETLPNP